MPENGETHHEESDADVLVLTRNRNTGKVAITGNIMDVELALDLLGRATRIFDVQFRILAATQAQEELKRRQAEFEEVRRRMGRS